MSINRECAPVTEENDYNNSMKTADTYVVKMDAVNNNTILSVPLPNEVSTASDTGDSGRTGYLEASVSTTGYFPTGTSTESSSCSSSVLESPELVLKLKSLQSEVSYKSKTESEDPLHPLTCESTTDPEKQWMPLVMFKSTSDPTDQKTLLVKCKLITTPVDQAEPLKNDSPTAKQTHHLNKRHQNCKSKLHAKFLTKKKPACGRKAKINKNEQENEKEKKEQQKEEEEKKEAKKEQEREEETEEKDEEEEEEKEEEKKKKKRKRKKKQEKEEEEETEEEEEKKKNMRKRKNKQKRRHEKKEEVTEEAKEEETETEDETEETEKDTEEKEEEKEKEEDKKKKRKRKKKQAIRQEEEGEEEKAEEEEEEEVEEEETKEGLPSKWGYDEMHNTQLATQKEMTLTGKMLLTLIEGELQIMDQKRWSKMASKERKELRESRRALREEMREERQRTLEQMMSDTELELEIN